jgi:hypothetical protein
MMLVTANSLFFRGTWSTENDSAPHVSAAAKPFFGDKSRTENPPELLRGLEKLQLELRLVCV